MVVLGLAANFTVTSEVAATSNNVPIPGLGVGTVDACPVTAIQNSSVRFLDCKFSAAASTGPITTYLWRLRYSGIDLSEETTSNEYRPARRDCGLFPNLNTNRVPGTSFVQLIAELRVRDAQGTVSDVRQNANIRLFPQNNCGASF
jgi:hypothetical protein